MEQRLSVITLGVADLGRAQRFYERVGWTRGNADDGVVFFQLKGLIVALWGRAELAADAQVTAEGSGFRSVALAYNTRDEDEVATILAEAEKAGGKIVKPAGPVFWGGHTGYFEDPDGHLWEIAWNPFWTIDDDGGVSLKKP